MDGPKYGPWDTALWILSGVCVLICGIAVVFRGAGAYPLIGLGLFGALVFGLLAFLSSGLTTIGHLGDRLLRIRKQTREKR